METQSKSPSSSERSRTATRGRKDKLPKQGIMPEGKRWRRTRLIEKEEVTKTCYSQSAYMYEIGDRREEGGLFLVNGVEVHPPGEGVKNRQELDNLVERAAEESPPVLPSVQELNAWNPRGREEFQKWAENQRNEHGSNWNFRFLQPFMALILVLLKWRDYLVKNTLAMDGPMSIRNMPGMNGWGEDGKRPNG